MFILKCYLFLKKLALQPLSKNKNITGGFKAAQPVVCHGKGKISFENNVTLGVYSSPFLTSHYTYIEARTPDAKITIGANTSINNAFTATAEKQINIGKYVKIGYLCNISDSNFHDLNPKNRNNSDPNPKAVIIEDHVFIGNQVTILKGVRIGKNSVVGANAVVTKSFPENVIIAGNPAKIINRLD